MNTSQIDFTDWQYRSRLQALLGVDELVEDVVEFLRQQGKLDNTYGMSCKLDPESLTPF